VTKQESKKILLLISESRAQPLTQSLLYKQIIRFLAEEQIENYVQIAFITLNNGVVNCADCRLETEDVDLKSQIINQKWNTLPPGNFRSGRLWVRKEQIEHMADNIVEYLRFQISDCGFKSKIENHTFGIKVIAYARGSYLEAVRIANKKLKSNPYNLKPIQEIFDDQELAQLQKKGIVWMKVGLRMWTAFVVFRVKIRFMVRELEEEKQLQLF
jgi:hypothetical protein